MITFRGVAVEPPTDLALTQKVVAGMKIPELKTGLRRLKVVGDTGLMLPSGAKVDVDAGGHIFVSNEAVAGGRWAREVFEIDGVSFAVVPSEFVVAYTCPA